MLTPDNTNLIRLMDACIPQRTQENMNKVIEELQKGNSTLLIPSKDSGNKNSQWEVTPQGKSFSWYLFNQQGLTVLAAFTSKESMLNWSKGTSVHYTEMYSKDILKFVAEGKAEPIDRILINPNNLNVFPLDRRISKTDLYNVPSGELLLGTPTNPISQELISKLKENLEKVNTITEAYQYGQADKNEFNIIIGIRLSIDSMNSKQAAQLALEKWVVSEKIERKDILMHIIKNDDEYEKIKGIQGSLIYKRQ